MEPERYLECLRSDYERIASVAVGALTEPVPSCPRWTVADLVHHVADVYLHKVQCMRLGREPDGWPPDHDGQDPVDRLVAGYAELREEFDRRQPEDSSYTWYSPDQTVGFWIRRMAQESVIHRIDAELAVGEITAVPDDLALDGIDEVLVIFLGWGSTEYSSHPELAPQLAELSGRSVAVQVGARSWLLRIDPTGVAVGQPGPGETPVDLSVTGEPAAVLRWLWNRIDDGAVQLAGDTSMVPAFHRLMAVD